MADAVPPLTGTSLYNAPCTVRCWKCGMHFATAEDFGPEAEYTCAKCMRGCDRTMTLDLSATPWWHRAVSGLALAACSVGFACLCVVLCWLVMGMGGCAVGYPVLADGTADLSNPSIGVGVGSVNQAAAGGLGAIGALTGNPLVLGLGALVANQLGKRRGWEEREEAATVQAPMKGAA